MGDGATVVFPSKPEAPVDTAVTADFASKPECPVWPGFRNAKKTHAIAIKTANASNANFLGGIAVKPQHLFPQNY